MSEKIQQAIERIDSQSEGQSDVVKIIAQHIIENFIKTDAAAKKLLNKKLTLQDCYKSVQSKAKGKAVGGCACVDDNVVYGWVREYYGLTSSDLKPDDKASNILSFDIFGDL